MQPGLEAWTVTEVLGVPPSRRYLCESLASIRGQPIGEMAVGDQI
jgi:hypothetical protein